MLYSHTKQTKTVFAKTISDCPARTMHKPRKSAFVPDSEDDDHKPATVKSRPSRISRLSTRAAPSGRSASASRPSTAAAAAASNSKSPSSNSLHPNRATIVTRHSRSASATPLRTTPIRASTAHPNCTTEKERKTANVELAQQLVERMLTHPQFRAEFLPNGLRSITNKQFSHTIAFFMRSVVGNARGHKLPDEPPLGTDDIAKWLTQIRYPHLQSRSWLKTPNVPHAFCHLVDLMSWLAAFIPEDASDPVPASYRLPRYYDATDATEQPAFPSAAFLCQLHGELHELFVMWNAGSGSAGGADGDDGDDGDGESEQMTEAYERLIGEFVQQRLPHVPNAREHIAKATERLVRELEEGGGGADADAQAAAVERAAEAKLEKNQRQLRQLEEEAAQIQDSLRTQPAVEAELREQLQRKEALEAERRQLADVVRTQSMSLSQRNELLFAVRQRGDYAAAKRAAIAELSAASHDRHMSLTRLLKEQLALGGDLQRLVRAVGERRREKQLQTWTADSRTDAVDFGRQLGALGERLRALRALDERAVPQLAATAGRLGDELSRLRANVAALGVEATEQRANGAQLAEERDGLNAVLGVEAGDFVSMLAKLRQQLAATARRADETEADVAERGKRLRRLREDNERQLALGERIGYAMVAKRAEGLRRAREEMATLRGNIVEALRALDSFE